MTELKLYITRQEVDQAWRESTIAADLYHDHQSEANFKNMMRAGDIAEDLQRQYNKQYDRMNEKPKRIVAVQTFDKLIVDPDFCPHLNVVDVHPDSPTGEPWDEPEPFAQCQDCGSVLNDKREWVAK